MTKEECRRYSEALAFAAGKHAEQMRKDGTPYIHHPIRVAMYLAGEGYDVRYRIAGLFHDLLEDTDATEEELRVFCDDEMLRAVKLVTKAENYVESEYIDAILKDPMAKAVKNADRIDNLHDLHTQSNMKFTERYLSETRQYFVGRFSPELDRLWEELSAESK